MVNYLKFGQELMGLLPQSKGTPTTFKLGKKGLKELAENNPELKKTIQVLTEGVENPTLEIAQKAQNNYAIAAFRIKTGEDVLAKGAYSKSNGAKGVVEKMHLERDYTLTTISKEGDEIVNKSVLNYHYQPKTDNLVCIETYPDGTKVYRAANKPTTRTIDVGDEERVLVNEINKKGISTDRIFTSDKQSLLEETIIENPQSLKAGKAGKVTKIKYPTTKDDYKEVVTELVDDYGDTVSYTQKLKNIDKNGKSRDLSRTVKRKFGQVSTSDGQHQIDSCCEKYVSRCGNTGNTYVKYTGKSGDSIHVYYDKKGNIISEKYSPAPKYPSDNNINIQTGSNPPTEPPHVHLVNA